MQENGQSVRGEVELERNERLSAGLAAVYLAACALHGRTPRSELVDRMDLQMVHRLAVRHSMQAVTYMGLAPYLSQKEEATAAEAWLLDWKNSVAQSMKRAVLFDLEREKIQKFLEAQGIWYAPLRGTILQNDYPRLGMRQMADNDILFDPTRREDLKNFMVENGYEVGFFNREYPDSYVKNGIMFDMHFELFMNTAGQKRLYDYYKNVKDRLVKTEGTAHGYHFKPEDFYVYVVAHAYKHFSSSGNGLRSLMDVYVHTHGSGKALNWNDVDRELDLLGLSTYEKKARSLAEKLFSGEGLEAAEQDPTLSTYLTEEESALFGYHIASGTYGNVELRSQNELDAFLEQEDASFKAKFKFCMARLFPKPEYFRINYPRIYKTKILIPFAVLWRILVRMILRPRKRFRELKMLIQKKK